MEIKTCMLVKILFVALTRMHTRAMMMLPLLAMNDDYASKMSIKKCPTLSPQ